MSLEYQIAQETSSKPNAYILGFHGEPDIQDLVGITARQYNFEPQLGFLGDFISRLVLDEGSRVFPGGKPNDVVVVRAEFRFDRTNIPSIKKIAEAALRSGLEVVVSFTPQHNIMNEIKQLEDLGIKIAPEPWSPRELWQKLLPVPVSK